MNIIEFRIIPQPPTLFHKMPPSLSFRAKRGKSFAALRMTNSAQDDKYRYPTFLLKNIFLVAAVQDVAIALLFQ